MARQLFVWMVLVAAWIAIGTSASEAQTLTYTRTFTQTLTFTPTLTRTGTIPVTYTLTRTLTRTNTPTPDPGTPTNTYTKTFTNTPTPTPSNTPLPWAPTSTSTSVATPLNCAVNENFEDGDLVTPFGGDWTALTWGTGSSAAVSNTNPGAGGTNRALYVMGSNPDSGSGWGTEGGLNYGQVPVDLSNAFAGISFYVKALSPVTFRVQLKSAAGDGSSDYGADFAVGTSWQLVSIPRAQWTSVSGTPTSLNSALAQSQAFQWRSVGGPNTTNWIIVDEICVSSLQVTPTPTVTIAPVPYVWKVPEGQVATVCGCSIQAVQDARGYQISEFLTYIIMRLTVHCGCSAAEIMRLRQNMAWDDIAAYYGVNWQVLVNEVMNMMDQLPADTAPPANDVRGAANNPADVPAVVPPLPVPTEQLILLPPVYVEVCP
jgi:hypothetical protein